MSVWKRRAAYALGGIAALFGLVLVSPARRFVVAETLPVVSITTDPMYQSPEKLREAFSLPVAKRYEGGPIVYQTNGSICGPTSLANVFRSLGTSEATPKSILQGTGLCSTGICWGGVTLDELADVARGGGKNVRILRDLSYDGFREELRHVNEGDIRYVVNFDRGPLFGKRGGHHSPVAAYLEKEDHVLVIDVNEKFRPWLVQSRRLFDAMDTVDPSTEKKRGLLRIE